MFETRYVTSITLLCLHFLIALLLDLHQHNIAFFFFFLTRESKEFTISVHLSQYFFLFHHSTDLPAWNNLLSSMESRVITLTTKAKTVLPIILAEIKSDVKVLCVQLQVKAY